MTSESIRSVRNRFMFRGLGNRNDPNVLAALCMRHGYDLIVQQSERQTAALAIALAIVLRRERQASKDSGFGCKVDAMLP